MDPIRPVSPPSRAVPPVDLTHLTPLEREREKERRERERRRRQKAEETHRNGPDGPDSGIDVRA